ncbi:MAG: hypothetical protein ACRDRL_24840 [Sciscionella sp.]
MPSGGRGQGPCGRRRRLVAHVAVVAALAVGLSMVPSATALAQPSLPLPPIPIPVPVPSVPVPVVQSGQTAYVANTDGNSVTPIDLATNTAGTPIPVGDGPGG